MKVNFLIKNDLNIRIVYIWSHFSYMYTVLKTFSSGQTEILYRTLNMIIDSIPLNNLVLLSYTNTESLFHSIQFAFRGFSFLCRIIELSITANLIISKAVYI